MTSNFLPPPPVWRNYCHYSHPLAPIGLGLTAAVLHDDRDDSGGLFSAAAIHTYVISRLGGAPSQAGRQAFRTCRGQASNMAICPMNEDDDDTTLPYSTLGIAKNLTHHDSACLPAWPGVGTRQDTSSVASSSLPGIRASTDRPNSRSVQVMNALAVILFPGLLNAQCGERARPTPTPTLAPATVPAPAPAPAPRPDLTRWPGIMYLSSWKAYGHQRQRNASTPILHFRNHLKVGCPRITKGFKSW